MLKEFKAFVLRGNVVDLAVAVVIGAAFGAVVTSFVTNLLTPLVGMIGGSNFETLHFTINDSPFFYGLVLNALVSFLLVSAAIFFVVIKPLTMLAERRKRGEAVEDETPTPSTEALLLAEIRDLLKAR